jgi:hypothetical protein
LAKEYVVLLPISFPARRDESGKPLPDEQQRDPHGDFTRDDHIWLEDEMAADLLDANLIRSAN